MDAAQRRASEDRDARVFEAVAAALGDASDLGLALERTLEIIAHFLDLASGWIWLYDDETERFYLAASWQLPPYLREPVQMTGSNCWCFESFRDGDFVSENVDVIECSRLQKAERSGESDLTAGMKYHASVALRAGSRQLGIMNLSGPHWRALDERDLRLLATLGAHVGMAVDRENLRERSERLARTEERTRLARDIHDTLAQDLTAIALQLEGALRHLSGEGESRMRVEKALEVTREALGSARDSVLGLRSDPLGGKPLGAALHALARRFTSDTGIIATFRDRSRGTPAHEIEVALFRIAAEALANVRRHAKARRVEIVLESDESANRLTIDDDGIGVTDTTGEGRYGIVGMRERAAEACASFAIEALPVGGTRVLVVVPGAP
jgi:two-component system NarL family sensor kinase